MPILPTEPLAAAGRPQRTVRDATFAVMRQLGMTTIFGNPGSTEIPFLTDLPGDIHFVLALHEGSVVGMATGYAMARGEPSLVNLHTAAGLGNAVNAIANARDCHVPLVIVVGQQDRRHLAFEPFLTGRELDRMAGSYPVWTNVPIRAQDVPGAIARAYHESHAARGPALIVVPMDDWLAPADELAASAPRVLRRASAIDPQDLAELAGLIAEARSPALVVGGGADSEEGWRAVVALAERLRCPVWQESFARRAGFPQDHELFAGYLPWRRDQLRRELEPHDLVLAIGTGAFRLYLFERPGPVVGNDTRVAIVTDDAGEAHRSAAELALVGPVGAACRELAAQVPRREVAKPQPLAWPSAPPPPQAGEPLRAAHVLGALAASLPPDVVLVEETPSSQPELYRRIPIRAPLGLVSAANGALGFGLPASVGLRLGLPGRPVVAVLGDGSAMYAIQALWSAVRYDVGVLVIVMANGGYAIMDQLAKQSGGVGAWPSFGGIDISGIARSLGCRATRVGSHEELTNALGGAIVQLTSASEPLVIEALIAADDP